MTVTVDASLTVKLNLAFLALRCLVARTTVAGRTARRESSGAVVSLAGPARRATDPAPARRAAAARATGARAVGLVRERLLRGQLGLADVGEPVVVGVGEGRSRLARARREQATQSPGTARAAAAGSYGVALMTERRAPRTPLPSASSAGARATRAGAKGSIGVATISATPATSSTTPMIRPTPTPWCLATPASNSSSRRCRSPGQIARRNSPGDHGGRYGDR